MEFACKQDLGICPAARKYDKPFVPLFCLRSPANPCSASSLVPDLPRIHSVLVFMKRKTVKKLAKRISNLTIAGIQHRRKIARVETVGGHFGPWTAAADGIMSRNTIFLIHFFYRISSTHSARSKKLNIRSRLSCSADSRIISPTKRGLPRGRLYIF